jgi:predicted P-loop ATPase
VWDGVPRLDTVAERILSAEPSPINCTMVRAWFVSAVARAMDPGCKCDTSLVLVGAQGARKSTFFSVLAGEWFSDTTVDIENKDAMLQINGAWIYELGEIEHVTGRAHAGRIKAFISSAKDTFRAPFHRTLSAFPRSNVIVGSTNEEQFLNDPTGSRRFHCVRIGGAIDIEVLKAERDQLWAEAVAAYQAREAWWLTPEAEAALREASERFRVSDPWEGAVGKWLAAQAALPVSEQKPITSERILAEAIGKRVEDYDQRASNRVAAILQQRGFKNKPEWVDGGTKRVWRLA